MADFTEVLYVEPQANYPAIIAQYLRHEPEQAVFIPNVEHARQFAEAAAQAGISLEGRMIFYRSVNADIDNHLYGEALVLAEKMVELLLETSVVHPVSRRALEVALHDRFVAILRGPYELRRLRDRSNASFRMVLRPSTSAVAARQFCRETPGTVIEDRHLGRKPADDPELQNMQRMLPGERLAIPATYDFERLERVAKPGTVLYFTNIRDKQYRNTSLPVVKAIAQWRDAYVLMTNYADQGELAAENEIPVERVFTKEMAARRIERAALPDGYCESQFMCLEKFERFCLGHWYAIVRALAGYFVDYLGKQLIPLLMFLNELRERMAPVVKGCATVAVLPGRYLEAGLIVGLANEAGVPTVEIQSGTISPTARFVKPAAKDVLCIDTFSHQVYAQAQRHPSVHIVGSPKIDFDVGPFRGVTREQARAEIEELAPYRDARILTLATQPIGVRDSSDIVRVVIEALTDTPEVVLLVKQHPNEDDTYTEAYLTIARDCGHERIVVSKTINVHRAIIAANEVLTYYSTVGLEAFALNRTAICVNPFSRRPPFDLVVMGVAHEVTNAVELAVLLGSPKSVLDADPSLSMLQDGRATERCVEFIKGVIARRG